MSEQIENLSPFEATRVQPLSPEAAELIGKVVFAGNPWMKGINATGGIEKHAARTMRLTFHSNPFLCQEKLSWHQMLFLTFPTGDSGGEMLFGGARGGGKTRANIMAALQYVTVPNYKACIVRRTLNDLEQSGGAIDQSHEILDKHVGKGVRYNGARYSWEFDNGAVLDFKYLGCSADRANFRGGAWQYFGVEELTEMPLEDFEFLYSSMRKTIGMPVPLRMRATTNPGSQYHEWVKQRFIKKKGPKGAYSVFIPALAKDNPFLDHASYMKNLGNLGLVERARSRDGDWDIQATGNTFKIEQFRTFEYDGNLQEGNGNYIIGGKRIPMESCTRFAAADIAGTEAQKGNDPDWSVIQVWDHAPSGDMFLIHQFRGRNELPEVEQRLCEMHWDWHCQFSAIEKNGIGLPIVQSAKRRGVQVIPVISKKDKWARSQSAQVLMENGQVWFKPNLPNYDDFLAECLAFPGDGNMKDDQVDCLSVACQQVSRTSDPRKWKRQEEHETERAASEVKAKEVAREQEQGRRFERRKFAELLEDESMWVG